MTYIGDEIKIIDNLILRKIIRQVPNNNNVSLIQMNIILYLLRHQARVVYQHDIEKATSLRRSTISGILKTMEKNGIIERNDSINDGRSKEISLTKKAVLNKDKCKKNALELEHQLQKNISADDMKIFFKVTNQIKNNLMEDKNVKISEKI